MYAKRIAGRPRDVKFAGSVARATAVVIIIGLAANGAGFANSFPFPKHGKISRAGMNRALDTLNVDVDEATIRSWHGRLKCATFCQDVFHFFSARAHFDNCNFVEGMAEIRRFQLRVDGEYQKLSKSDTRKRADRHRRNIIHTVGRLLHGVQDFFSHSNFVEVRQDKFASIDDVPTPDFWSEKGRDDLLDLRRDGLVSHFFTFSFPRRCDPRPRGPLSKDQAGDGAGPIRTRWIDKRNSTTLTGHEAALYFAEEATYHVFLQLFREYPEIIPASANGSAKAPTD